MTSRPVLVQKFGGTSVATAERRQQVVEHVRRARDGGHDVAIVVSAMGRRGDPYATDTLLDLLRGDGGAVDPRDYTLVFVTGEMIAAAVMAQALKRAGIPAVGFGSGNAASANHAPNENIAVADYLDHIRAFGRFLHAFA